MPNQKKYHSLKDFLRKHKTIPEKNFTHTALGQPPNSFPGSYCIDDDELSLFHNLYNKDVFEGEDVAHLTERHKDLSPILIDLDLRHDIKHTSRQYKNKFIVTFLELYVEEIKKVLPSIRDEKLVAFVLEKKSPNFQNSKQKGVFKDGLHIVFPYIITEPKIQYMLRYNTIENENVIALFNTINTSNPMDDVFDIAVIERNNWQMYGSCKPNHEAYVLTKMYKNKDSGMKEVNNNLSNKEILKTLSIRHIKEEHVINNNMYYEHLESDFADIPKTQQVKKKKKVNNKKRKSPSKKNFVDDDELVFIRKIVAILDDTRADCYYLWIRLGWCLHNIDYRLLEDWITLSKRSDKFVDGECEKEWVTMDNEGLGLGTLYLWAKNDNLSKYKDLSQRNLRKCMLDALTLEPNDIARVVYCLYKNEFVSACSKKNTWFQFKNHRWVELDDAIELRKRFSCEVIDEYDKLDKFLSDQISSLSDEDEKDLKRKKKETVGKIIKKLKNTGFKKMVVQECNELFHDPKFENKLDKNLNLIGFENGIYDLKELEFRNGLPEDYLSYSARINYVDHDDDDEDIQDVKEFMSQVLPKKAVREYVFTLLGSFLSGKNINEKFHIWTGCGGNGKSKLIELFEYCFGDYCCKLPVKLLTESRGRAEGATPALVRTKGKRFACLQEPDKYEEINVGLMKELTGNDTIIARGLHKDPVEFKPQFKMVLTCNDLPKVSANDRGTWRRISVVEFISKFVDEPDPKEPYEFKIDDTLDEKLKLWPEAFMYLLIEYYKKFKKNGIKEPADVKRNTEDYQVESDMFVGFINERLIEVDNADSDGIKLDDIYFVYGDWHKQAYGQNTKCPTRKELKENLAKKYGKKATNSKNMWMGLAFKENDTENQLMLDE